MVPTIFWDSQEILPENYKTKGNTITKTYYPNILACLKETKKKMRCGKMAKDVLLFQDKN